MKGFTLIETIIVVAIVAAIVNAAGMKKLVPVFFSKEHCPYVKSQNLFLCLGKI